MPPAARLTDMHVCPMVTGVVPHVGGPIVAPGMPNVLIGMLPAARVTDMCVCVGPPDVIVRGSTGVFIGGLPAARLGDNTAHGGVIVMGCFTVMIGEISPNPPPVNAPVMSMVPPLVLPPFEPGVNMPETPVQSAAGVNNGPTGGQESGEAGGTSNLAQLAGSIAVEFIPGKGLYDAWKDAQAGNYGSAVFNVITEIPIAKAGKLRKVFRAADKLKDAKAASNIAKTADKTVVISRKRYPEAAKHIEEAQKAGHPDILTIDRGGAKQRRKESLKGVKTQKGKDRDEYPPAMFEEGGKGASVKHIDPSDNRGAGSFMGNELKDMPDGSKVRIKPGDD